jgi:integrase
MRLHDLRHGYGSRLISVGASPKAVAVAMGDTLATVLKTYAHLLPGDLDAVAAATSKAVFGGRVQGVSSGEAGSDGRRIGI